MGLSTAVDQTCYLILWILCIFVDLEWAFDDKTYIE